MVIGMELSGGDCAVTKVTILGDIAGIVRIRMALVRVAAAN